MEIDSLLADAYELWETGHDDKAEKIYKRILKISPRNYHAHVGLGRVYLQGDDLSKAERTFKRAVKLGPKEGEAYFHLGECADKRGDEDVALKYYRQAAERGHWTMATLLRLGESCMSRGAELGPTSERAEERHERLSEGVHWFGQLITECTKYHHEDYLKDKRIHTLRGLCYRVLGNLKAALQEFDRAIDVFGYDRMAWYLKIHTLLDMRNLNGARLVRVAMQSKFGNWVPVERIFEQSFEEFEEEYILALEKGQQVKYSKKTSGLRQGSAERIERLARPWVPSTVPLERTEREKLLRIKGRIDKKGEVVGDSSAMLRVFERIHMLNEHDSDKPVVLLGETGVGKSFIARFVQSSSARSDKPYKALNAQRLAGADFTISKGEVVGFARGHGISGIDPKGKPGLFDRCKGGTVFIDEVAYLPHEMQAFLLTVLQGDAVQPVGDLTKGHQPDIRFIFATNRDPLEEIAEGRIYHDLWRRISPYCVTIPPLRERREDIPPLANKLMGNVKCNSRVLLALMHHDWPGNVGDLVAVLGRIKAVGDTMPDLGLLELPKELIESIEGMDEEEARIELVRLLKATLEEHGLRHRQGLNKELAKLLAVSESTISKLLTKLDR